MKYNFNVCVLTSPCLEWDYILIVCREWDNDWEGSILEDLEENKVKS